MTPHTTPLYKEHDLMPRTDESLQIFLLFFERVFSVSFAPVDREEIIGQIQQPVRQDDPSGQQLVEYVLQVAGELGSVDKGRVETAKMELRDIFIRAFVREEPNQRSRILAAVHRALERSRPGVTGIQVRAISPFRTMAAPISAPMPVSGTAAGATPSAAEDAAAQVRRVQREMEEATLKSNIEKMRHEMNMSIIKNIGGN